MDQNNATEKEISIRPVKRLTENMLGWKIAETLTLEGFLADECTTVADGSVRLYKTLNCDHYRHLEENRFVNEAHVQCLMDSFEKDGYLFTILYVNEKLEIIDGQHRFEAIKRKGLPVYFMVMPGWGIREVTILNVNSRNWTIIDFMETHAKAGNPNYIRFKEFFDAHEFDVTVCQLIITGKRSKGYASIDKFRSGQMIVDEQQITDAFLKTKRLAELKAFHPCGWKSRNFVEAFLALFNTRGYDHEHMIAKLKTYPELMLLEARSLRVEEYLKLLVEKYNFRRMKDRIEVIRR